MKALHSSGEMVVSCWRPNIKKTKTKPLGFWMQPCGPAQQRCQLKRDIQWGNKKTPLVERKTVMVFLKMVCRKRWFFFLFLFAQWDFFTGMGEDGWGGAGEEAKETLKKKKKELEFWKTLLLLVDKLTRPAQQKKVWFFFFFSHYINRDASSGGTESRLYVQC